MDSIDFDLLYRLMEANGIPQSTWALATQACKDNKKAGADRNQLDSLYRYHLETMRQAGIVEKVKVEKDPLKGIDYDYTGYKLNPKGYLCTGGTFIILSNPITILACPDILTCPTVGRESTCAISIYKNNKQHFVVKGCTLLRKASPTIIESVYDALNKNAVVPEEKSPEAAPPTGPTTEMPIGMIESPMESPTSSSISSTVAANIPAPKSN